MPTGGDAVSIQMYLKDDLYFPVIVCDVCNERIEKLNGGNCYWELTPNDGLQGPIGFSHKECTLEYDARFGRWRDEATGKRIVYTRDKQVELPEGVCPPSEGSDDASKFPLWLLVNSGISVWEVKRHAAQYEDAIEKDAHPCKTCGKGKMGTCSRCGKRNVVVERHHFAPRAKFSDPDSWPTALLCEKCHDEWHEKMRG